MNSKEAMGGWGFVSDFGPVKTSECWLQKHCPKTRGELAVHKKKVDQVAGALNGALATHRHRVIVLSGPCGTGKSATIRALANDLNFAIEEWSNPIHEYEVGAHYETELSKFRSFLLSSSRYGSLFGEKQQDREKRKIVLIEGIPTFATQSPGQLWELIASHTRCMLYPLVLILSDTALGVRVPLEYVNISFNPVAVTFLTKALNKIASKELITANIPDIVQECEGDLRNAILTLQFHTVSNRAVSNTVSHHSQDNGRGKKRRVQSTNTRSKRDTPLFMLHAIGKLLHAKRKEGTKLDCTDERLGRRELQFVPETVAEQCVLSGDMLTQFLHHNYITFYKDIERLQVASDMLCDSDNLSNYWVDGSTNTQMLQYTTALSTRAIVYSRDTTHTPGFTPICKPVQREIENKCKDHALRCREVFALSHLGANTSFLIDTVPYLKKLRYKATNSEQYSLLQSLSKYDVTYRAGQGLGDKETAADLQDAELDYISSQDDQFLALSRDLEEEIQDFSD